LYPPPVLHVHAQKIVYVRGFLTACEASPDSPILSLLAGNSM